MPGTKPNCTSKCPQNYYADPIDRTCKVATDCPTTPVRYYADDTTRTCEECPLYCAECLHNSCEECE